MDGSTPTTYISAVSVGVDGWMGPPQQLISQPHSQRWMGGWVHSDNFIPIRIHRGGWVEGSTPITFISASFVGGGWVDDGSAHKVVTNGVQTTLSGYTYRQRPSNKTTQRNYTFQAFVVRRPWQMGVYGHEFRVADGKWSHVSSLETVFPRVTVGMISALNVI